MYKWVIPTVNHIHYLRSIFADYSEPIVLNIMHKNSIKSYDVMIKTGCLSLGCSFATIPLCR